MARHLCKALVAVPLATWACGSDITLGGKHKPGGSQPAAAASDQTADKDHNPDFLAKLATSDVKACQKAGMIYIRRLGGCSTSLKLATYSCDRAGIVAAFAPTGYLIEQALDLALGKAGAPADHGDGYVIDQCGESASGERYVDLVKQDSAGALHVRELDASL